MIRHLSLTIVFCLACAFGAFSDDTYDITQDNRVRAAMVRFNWSLNKVSELRVEKDRQIKNIRNNKNLDRTQRLKEIAETERRFQNDSKKYVSKARQPLVNLLVNRAQQSSSNPYVLASDGTPLQVLDPETNRMVDNPNSSGWDSDTDWTVDEETGKQIVVYAKQLGLDDREKYGQYFEDDAPLVSDHESTSEVRILNMTANKDMQLLAETPGTAAYRAKAEAMASNMETFVHASMIDQQVGQDAVHAHDLINKAAEVRASDGMTIDSVLDGPKRDAYERFSKSTKKMLDMSVDKNAPEAKKRQDKIDIIRQEIDRIETESGEASNLEAEKVLSAIEDTKTRIPVDAAADVADDQDLKKFTDIQKSIQDRVVADMEAKSFREIDGEHRQINFGRQILDEDSDRIKRAELDLAQLAEGSDEHEAASKKLQDMKDQHYQQSTELDVRERYLQDSVWRQSVAAETNAQLGAYEHSETAREVDNLRNTGDATLLSQIASDSGGGGDDGSPPPANQLIAIPENTLQSNGNGSEDNTPVVIDPWSNQTTEVGRFKLGYDAPEDTSGLRKSLNQGGQKVFSGALGAMDKVDKLMKGYEVTTKVGIELYEGNYAAAWDNAKDMVADELKDKATEAVMGKIVPGYGQLKGAFDVGWLAGEQLGKIPISSDGTTIHQAAENKMRKTFFNLQDTISSEKNRFEAVRAAYAKEVKAGRLALPEGMRHADVVDAMRMNLALGLHPYDGVDLQPGATLIAEVEAEQKQAAAQTAANDAANDAWGTGSQGDGARSSFTFSDAGGDPTSANRIRQQLAAQRDQDKAAANAQMQAELSDVQREREEKARRDAAARAALAEGFLSLGQGLQSMQSAINTRNAELDAKVEANRQEVQRTVDTMIARGQSRPSATDLIMGKADWEAFKQSQQGAGRTLSGENNNSATTDPWGQPLKKPVQKPANDLERECLRQNPGSTLEQCRQLIKRAKPVAKKFKKAKTIDDFVKTFCSYAQSKEERDKCKPLAEREFRKIAGK